VRQIYVSDLDGTLLRDDGTLSDFSRRTLKTLLAGGLVFTVASARSINSIRQVLGDLPLSCPLVEMNGAFITDFASGRHEVVNAFAPSLAAELLARGSARGLAPFLSAFDGSRDRLFYTEITNGGLDWYLQDRLRAGDSRLCRLPQAQKALDYQLVCCVFIDRGERLAELAAELRRDLTGRLELYLMENPYSPGWSWLSVYDRAAGKHRALKQLIARLGYGPEQLVAFGDQANDLGLFRLASVGVAVANAAPELKASASRVIGSNQEDSVARYLLSELEAGNI
jgi:Cof subfamily protein (haloacid dehalogenase superfamily)